MLLPVLAILAGIFVISTKNPIISVFNLIVLYILVAFYLIFIGLTFLGISYIVIYIGAIAILFLFVIMMIDIEVVEKRSNNYLPLLFLLLGGFFFTLKNYFHHLGLVKMKSLSFKGEYIYNNSGNEQLFNIRDNLKKEIKLDYSGNLLNVNNDWVNGREINNNNWIMFDIDAKSNFEINNILFNYINNNTEYIRHNILKSDIWEINSIVPILTEEKTNNYLLIMNNWNSAINKITQISAIGDVLYTLYHSYIYILSVILLLGMIGAIILTADSFQEIKKINLHKMNSLLIIFQLLKDWYRWLFIWLFAEIKLIKFCSLKFINCFKSNLKWLKKNVNNKIIINNRLTFVPAFVEVIDINSWHSEFIMGNLMYFVVTSLVVAILLLSINSYFSLNVKYLEKGGGFECGFTSFLQTRERFNVIFYRVSLLFLVFDLEIILIFPYPAIYQKNQNISKNNVLAFIYILVIGFIYELKEGALNIVKKGRSNEIDK